MGINRGVSCGPCEAHLACQPNVLTGLLVSIALAKPKVYDEYLAPFRPFVSDREVIWFDISMNVTMSVHVLDSPELKNLI